MKRYYYILLLLLLFSCNNGIFINLNNGIDKKINLRKSTHSYSIAIVLKYKITGVVEVSIPGTNLINYAISGEGTLNHNYDYYNSEGEIVFHPKDINTVAELNLNYIIKD